jgi:hypothetical protein
MKKWIFMLLFTFLLLPLFSQSINIVIAPSRVIYNYFYSSYLDPSNPGGQPQLFMLTATNTGQENISDYEIHLSFFWREYELIDDAVVVPKSGTPYEVIEPGEILNLSNRDILISGDASSFTNIEGLEFDDILDASDEFKDLVLDLGYFPDGDYIFEIILRDDSGEAISNPATFTFTIISPTAVSLISPGSPFGLEPAFILDLHPYFLWFSNLSDFTLKLYEVDEMCDNPDDIPLQSDPVFEVDLTGTTVLSYPTSAYPLQYNTLYAWQVCALISSPFTGQENTLESSFFIFNIADEEGGSEEDQSIINFLQQINIVELEEILQFFEEGYSFDNLYLNGEEISIDFLNELLQKILSGELRVSGVGIE